MVWRIARYLAGARLRHDDSGAMVVVIALVMTVLMGMLGIGVEVGSWYMTRRALQTAADAAAIAGALEEARGSAARVTAAARQEAARNGAVVSKDVITIRTPPASGAYAGDPQAVEAIITRPEARLFSAVLGSGAVDISARAVARVRTIGQACVLALDPAASGAITGQGSSTLNMQGCTLAANSTDSSAITLSGSASVAAHGLWTAGGTSLGGSSNLNFATPPATYTWPLSDPYASLTIPALGSCLPVKNVTVFTPGTYCSNIDLQSGAFVFKPGTYYLDGASLKINASAIVTCDCIAPGSGVTFVFTSRTNANQIGSLTVNGSATVDLRAPSDASYPFPGILFYQDRQAPENTVNTINGGSSIVMNGAFYFPSAPVKWTGNNTSSGANTCVEIIARTVEFNGNSALDNSGCAALGVKPLLTTAATLGE